MHRRRRQVLDAFEHHRQAVNERPSHADLHYHLGLLLAGQGELAGAIEQYRRACEINPTYTKARIKLGLMLKQIPKPSLKGL